MSDSTNNQTAASKTLSHIVHNVRVREGGEGFWTRIGAAWAHNDGKGFNIQVETVPLDRRITFRVPSEKAK